MKKIISIALAVVMLFAMGTTALAADRDFAIKDGVLIRYTGSGVDVTIPDGVTSIGNSAFAGCTSLAIVTIPDSVESIGDYAFSGCTSLTSIILPSSVTSIGNLAFAGCTSITSIILPSSVTSIGNSAFFGCTSLKGVKISDGVPIRDAVMSIGSKAFAGCTSLASITLPGNVKAIGDDAFLGCFNLCDAVFNGTQAQWAAIEIGDNNELLENVITMRSGATASIISEGYPEIVYGIGGLAMGFLAAAFIFRKKKVAVSSTSTDDEE